MDKKYVRPHPWHGIAVGPNPPEVVTSYIEITPHDPVKYELDKVTGYLKVDRPQRTSSNPPLIYGFIPRTYCAENVAALAPGAEVADEDPLDICIVCEAPINRVDILCDVRVVGGMQMIDDGEADDKIIAVLEDDSMFASARSINDIPKPFINKLYHYLTTYKLVPGEEVDVTVDEIYDVDHAKKVVEAAMEDYLHHFGE
jgi:inorganic pyrophosphatase